MKGGTINDGPSSFVEQYFICGSADAGADVMTL